MENKEHRKKKPLACINGVKGAISLFLAVLMTPFLTIAVLLVEAGRYNSAVSVLDEALGVTSLSVLADYDDYLQDRWGLLAMSQGMDINSVYSQHLNTNSAVMGSTLNINQVLAKGDYALSDAQILEAQLLEYCKLNAPTKLGSEIVSKVVSLTGLLDKLEGLKSLGNIASLLTKGVSTLDSGITMAKSAEELKKAANRLDELKNEYNTNYTNFETKMNALIKSLEQKEDKEEELKPLKKELTKLQQELENLEAKKPTSDSAKKKNQEDIKAKKAEIKAKEKEIKPIQDAIDKLNKTIKSQRTAADKAKTAYATTISEISKTLGTFKEHMASIDGAITEIQKNVSGAVSDSLTIAKDLETKRSNLIEKKGTLEDCEKSLEELEKQGVSINDPSYVAGLEYKIALEGEVSQIQTEIGEMETAKAVADATNTGIGKMAEEWTESFGGYSDKTLGEIINGFDKLYGKVNKINASKVTADTEKITKGKYKNVAVAGYIGAADIQEYLDAQEKKLKEGSLKALLDGLIAIYNQLMGLSIFFEAKLNSVIDVQYYNDTFGGLPGGAAAQNPILEIMQNISDICASGKSLIKNLAKLKLLKMLEDLKSIVENVISLFENIGKIILNFLTNIAELFTSYEKWYTTVYCTYNLACRTDFSDGSNSASISTMTGYSVGKDSFDKASDLPNVPIFGEIAALIKTITSYMGMTGKDIMFTGAELEYIMFGSNSEVANQLYVFTIIYFIRMLSSIPAIMADAEVQSLAASATLGYPVVIALYILLEPLVQTVLLVNGNDQDLIPTEVYLSPSGLPKLVNELIWFCNLTVTEADALSNKMVDAVSKSRDDYDYQSKLYEYKTQNDPANATKGFSLEFSYKDYCLVVLLLTVTKEQQIARLSNLIQMETLCYYTNQKAAYTFDLKKSFTYLAVEADVSVNQIMPSLADSSLFEVHREHYRGY